MVASRYQLTHQGAMNAIRTLVDLKILEPAHFKLGRGAQTYVAPEVIDALA